FTPPKKISAEPEPEAPIRVQPTKGKGGKKLTDEEKLERARALRAKAAEERRRAQEAAGEAPAPSPGSNPLNKGAKKKRKKRPGPREHRRSRGASPSSQDSPEDPNERQRRHA